MKKEYFISLSYKDEEVFNKSRNLLPAWITPHVFPAKDVTPDQMVSDELLTHIRQRDGLLYLSSKNSSNSFWVALERDYAIRIQKPVYRFDPINGKFNQDLSKPLELKVFPSYSREDKHVVDNIVYLLKERYIEMFTDNAILPGQNVADEINQAIHNSLEAGGYSVFFISEKSMTSEWVKKELEITMKKYADRIIPCLIDSTDTRVLPQFFQEYQILTLYDKRCQDGINRNRLDDLIVLLYWYIYRNTRKENSISSE